MTKSSRKWFVVLVAVSAGLISPYVIAEAMYYVGIYSPVMTIVTEFEIRSRFMIMTLFNLENVVGAFIPAFIVAFPVGLLLKQEIVKHWLVLIGAVLVSFIYSSFQSKYGIEGVYVVFLSVGFASFVIWSLAVVWLGSKVARKYVGSSNKSAQPTQ